MGWVINTPIGEMSVEFDFFKTIDVKEVIDKDNLTIFLF